MPAKVSAFWAEHGRWLLLHGYRVKHKICTWDVILSDLRQRAPGHTVTMERASQQFRYLRDSTPGHVPLTLEQALRLTPTDEAPAPPAPDPVAAEADRIARHHQILRERDALKDVAGEKSFRAYFEGLIHKVVTPLPALPPHRVTPVPKGAAVETMVQAFTDWHAYEIVSAERTRGFNAYNAAVMGQRVRRVVDTHRSIKARMEKGGGWRFPRLVLSLNGDFMSGTIHEVERHSDAPNVVLAAWATGLVLAQAIRDLAGDYESVECFCTSGNHGRLPDAKRMQQKDPLRSWDTLIYLVAREHLANLSHVRWFIPDSYSVAFEVEGWRFLQTHGHDIKSWNAIPFYGINRMMANLNALEASRGTPFHAVLLGHFHNLSSMEAASAEYFVNGSLIGGTEFSVQGMGRSDKPRQWMLAVHPEHGITSRWPILGTCPADAPCYQVTPWDHLAA